MSRGLLVTGAAGFIGTNFVYYWRRRHPRDRLIAYDALTYAGNRENLRPLEESPGFGFVQGDIRDEATVARLLREEELDTIVHLAAESHVDRSIGGPDAFIDTNVAGTHGLLKAARAVWLDGGLEHRFHHVSTDEVYGSLAPEAPGFHEEQKYEPNSPYSASKAASDHLVRAYRRTYGLQATTSNCSNNYGPWHYPEKLIPLCIANILRGRPLPVYGDGMNIRDWLFVEDHCRGMELVIGRALRRGRDPRGTLSRGAGGTGPGLRRADPVRDRPGRARPALRHRRGQDRRRTGLSAPLPLRGRYRGDDRLVPATAGLVAAAAAGPGTRLARISRRLARSGESRSVSLVQTPRRPCWLPGQEAFVQWARFGAARACQASPLTECCHARIAVYASIAEPSPYFVACQARSVTECRKAQIAFCTSMAVPDAHFGAHRRAMRVSRSRESPPNSGPARPCRTGGAARPRG